ncbi:DUF1493 family protein [Phaeospirillum tilakii]|uniref:DUF1493 family protein n=1 Tax=Phaeospirillum tilakii TaxID=741673 RepID=A0ABW5CI90_9PROT
MNTREALFSIVADIAGSRPPISDSSKLCQDLSIMGDDAHELLTRIIEHFGTRFEGFDFQTYFPNETEAAFWHIGRRLGWRPAKKEITVGHLLAVIERGYWFNP